REYLRRGRPGERPLRARQANRPQRQDDQRQHSACGRPARGDARLRVVPEFCSLEGKTALVTGGSRGIGAAIARALAEAGATVTLPCRSGKDEAEAVAREAGARAVQADVGNPDEAKAVVDDAGELDILVNNAGVTRDGLIARMSDEDWAEVLQTNLSGVFHT